MKKFEKDVELATIRVYQRNNLPIPPEPVIYNSGINPFSQVREITNTRIELDVIASQINNVVAVLTDLGLNHIEICNEFSNGSSRNLWKRADEVNQEEAKKN